jgi:hypothetical protein
MPAAAEHCVSACFAKPVLDRNKRASGAVLGRLESSLLVRRLYGVSPPDLDIGVPDSCRQNGKEKQRAVCQGHQRQSVRAPGSRNKVTLLIEELLEGEAEQLTRKAIDLALEGDL